MANLKSYLNLTIGDNSNLREDVLHLDRSRQKRATSAVASSSADYQGPTPMDVDRIQDTKGKGNKGKNDHQKGKGKDAKGKGKEKEIRKEKNVIRGAIFDR